MSRDTARELVESQFRAYIETLSAERRLLVERFRIVGVARKVVGVGSVGTRAFMVLLEGRDNRDPLFLQIKEATSSVLEAYLPASTTETPGQRVVHGQRLMQPVSDIFPRLDVGRGERSVLLLATAAGPDGLRGRRGDVAVAADALRPHVRVDPGQGARAVG